MTNTVVTKITKDDIKRLRTASANDDPPAPTEKARIRVKIQDVDRAAKKRILTRITPSNFYHGMYVGARTITFIFNAPHNELKYVLLANGRSYQAARKNELAILFKNIPMVDGLNTLRLQMVGYPDIYQEFAIYYDFKATSYFGRVDPVTQQEFTADDDVVRCRLCLQYALRKSWQTASGPCPYSTLPNSNCRNRHQGFFGLGDPGFAMESR